MSLRINFEHSARPKCARCRHHGIVIPKKGHTKICPFLECECSKCYLVTQRTKIHALQREMRKNKKEQQLGASPGAASGDGPMGPPSGGAPERGTPADPWRSPEPGGQPASGLSTGDELPSTSGKQPPPNSASFNELGQMAPLPFIPFPFRMPSYYPSSYSSPPPHLLPNMPWVPPMPAGFGPVMFPQLHQGAVNYPSPPNPRPPAGCMQVFIRHPLPVSGTFKNQQQQQQQQHPPPPVPKTTEQDTAEQVNNGE